jgi:hypothetical protein
MAENTNVLSETALETQVDSEVYNPDINAAAGGRKVIHLTLVCDGVDIDIGELYDSVATVKADVSAVTRVVALTGEKDVSAARGTYIWNVGPA